MDEPEAGLSFTAQLALVGTLVQLADQPSSQVLIATHSPILAVVDHYRPFLDSPERYLRHLRDPE